MYRHKQEPSEILERDRILTFSDIINNLLTTKTTLSVFINIWQSVRDDFVPLFKRRWIICKTDTLPTLMFFCSSIVANALKHCVAMCKICNFINIDVRKRLPKQPQQNMWQYNTSNHDSCMLLRFGVTRAYTSIRWVIYNFGQSFSNFGAAYWF